MTLIAFLDLLEVLFLLYAAWVILSRELRGTRVFFPLAFLLAVTVADAAPNVVEWLGFEETVEPFEEYVQVLVPAAFFVLFSFANFERAERSLSARNRVLTALHTVTQHLHITPEPQDLWEDLLGRVINVMGFDGGILYLPGQETAVNIRMKWEGWERFADQVDLMDLEDTILAEVLAGRDPMLIENTDEVPDTFVRAMSVSGIRSAALFPIHSKTRHLGVMGIVSRTTYRFSEEEVDLFTMLGGHFGETAHNAFLLAESTRRAGELREALNARRYFLTLISDDIRQPLLRVRTAIQRLKEEMGVSSDPACARLLSEADRDCLKVEYLMDDVKELSLIDREDFQIDPVPLDVMQEIRKVADGYRDRAGEGGVSLEVVQSEDMTPVEADRDLLHNAIRQLVANGIRYTPSGGRVTLSASDGEETVSITVQDTGIGIEEEDAEKIFDMFYRAASARGREKVGTGLGLTIARRIARLHGGDLTFRPREGGGTVFTMVLPKLQMDVD